MTHDELKEMLHYDPETGKFKWNTKMSAGSYAGDEAGTKTYQGYRRITIRRTPYPAHRLAWFYMTGEWPKDQVDHINRDRMDNRWANLREATAHQNGMNKSRHRDNRTGFKGVQYLGYRAQICVNGKVKHLGLRDTAEEAHELYVAAAKEAFGEYRETE